MQGQAPALHARAGEWDKRSMRLFEKCGFTETKHGWVPSTDVFDDGVAVTMVLNRERFDAVPR